MEKKTFDYFMVRASVVRRLLLLNGPIDTSIWRIRHNKDTVTVTVTVGHHRCHITPYDPIWFSFFQHGLRAADICADPFKKSQGAFTA